MAALKLCLAFVTVALALRSTSAAAVDAIASLDSSIQAVGNAVIDASVRSDNFSKCYLKYQVCVAVHSRRRKSR
jgi:hypothetical protein